MKKLKEKFDSIDENGDGMLCDTELATVLLDIGYYRTQAIEKAKEIIDECDEDGDGLIDFEEFALVQASVQLSEDDMLIHTCFKGVCPPLAFCLLYCLRESVLGCENLWAVVEVCGACFACIFG